ncbi:carbohydrate-binding module family 1 protein [Phanerochaete sordida]|uniref:Carbohydrate-binding module family 1 protein n=1 Tax=Phanerochaete sordida TaxID=48140 RepID=A0A9P3LJU5_9APHY|nr:carbohydrate-binding module family 1 protein [Phanerochaete sordida]
MLFANGLVVASLLAAASAQFAQPWNKCGGEYYTGPTVCVDGWTCVYQNPYNSQCLQIASSSSDASSLASSSASS